ncbi:MAG: homoserine dehydrogenase [Deltaproteobacteria bacterium]|jgi:homoserine dehydrogenase|nr:homoserine dehydrogenase [Deltaproteobacteria bacterium]
MEIRRDSGARPLNLGLAGFGTVGRGLARILDENRDNLKLRSERPIRIRSILVRDPARARACPFPPQAKICADMDDLIRDPDIEVVVELMGGLEEAGRLIRGALEAGKHVVTANKALLAEEGGELFRLAARRGLHLGYEASVCGAIPIVQTLREGLSANRILTLFGILNGTSNYILSAMTSTGMSFDLALRQAQELGFAEADPSMDTEGLDAAHKLTLLIRLAWGVDYPFSLLPVEGISRTAPEDIGFAREFGYNIKLLGYARLEAENSRGRPRLEAGVFPTLVPRNYLLASVGDSYNAVRVEGNAAGSVFLHGRGAGSLPSGSAVAADILQIARGARPNNLGYVLPELPQAEILPPQETSASYYMRLTVLDRPGVLRDVAAVLAGNDISIAQAIQRGQKDVVPLVIMTHATTPVNAARALAQVKATGVLFADPVCYRVMPPSA